MCSDQPFKLAVFSDYRSSYNLLVRLIENHNKLNQFYQILMQQKAYELVLIKKTYHCYKFI